MRIATYYVLFAIVATVANIASQDLTVRVYQGKFELLLSVFVGTSVGLVIKYFLDKKYIFKFQVKNAAQDTKTFFLYTVMGLITTFIFWGFEFGFDYVFASKSMRYLGAIIGLSIGYYVKYQLDKKFVFVTRDGA